ncbi:MAG: DUF2064 domain-containing protein, partial [Coriobacteriia bacterium]|nr:DUF2064 domain-containing protein [Coriobacteriia bacterium]
YMLTDVASVCNAYRVDVIVSHTPVENASDEAALVRVQALFPQAQFIEQAGKNIFNKMANSVEYALGEGYEQAILIGSDLPSIMTSHLDCAFQALAHHELFFNPSSDGGYSLIAMSAWYPEVFDIAPKQEDQVLRLSLDQVSSCGARVKIGEVLDDIDTPEDVQDFLALAEKSEALAQTHTYKFFHQFTPNDVHD